MSTTPILVAIDATDTLPSTAPMAERWRLHHQARVHFTTPRSATISCAGRIWQLTGLSAGSAQWLAGLGPWPTPLPVPAGARPLAGWLHRQGLATRSCLATTSLVARGYSYLRPPVLARMALSRLRLPQPDDLAIFTGLVVLEDSEYDRALAWTLRRAGVPHVVAELSPSGSRVGSFLAERGCARCDDLQHGSPVPVPHPVRARPRPPAPTWMSDWAANQVVLAVRRWQAGVDLAPGWWWLDAHGNSGHAPVVPHPDCCGPDHPADASRRAA